MVSFFFPRIHYHTQRKSTQNKEQQAPLQYRKGVRGGGGGGGDHPPPPPRQKKKQNKKKEKTFIPAQQFFY